MNEAIPFITKCSAVAEDLSKWSISLRFDTAKTIPEIVDLLLGWVSLIAGITAFTFLIVAGFQYLTAGGNADNAKKGAQGILNAVIGMIIISLSYTIFRAIANYINGGTP
jgi:hypothetical protein